MTKRMICWRDKNNAQWYADGTNADLLYRCRTGMPLETWEIEEGTGPVIVEGFLEHLLSSGCVREVEVDKGGVPVII